MYSPKPTHKLHYEKCVLFVGIFLKNIKINNKNIFDILLN